MCENSVRVWHDEYQRYEIITASEGTFQGDPLALFFFCIAIHCILVTVKRDYPNVLLLSYADDNYYFRAG